MFQFSTFAPLKLWIHFRVTALIALPGFPIRISPGHSSFDNSPELFAVYNVLLRLSTPRHPPCALYSLISIPLLQSLRASKSRMVALIQTLDFFRTNLSICSPLYLSLSSLHFSKMSHLPIRTNIVRTQSARRAYTRVNSGCQILFSKKSLSLSVFQKLTHLLTVRPFRLWTTGFLSSLFSGVQTKQKNPGFKPSKKKSVPLEFSLTQSGDPNDSLRLYITSVPSIHNVRRYPDKALFTDADEHQTQDSGRHLMMVQADF